MTHTIFTVTPEQLAALNAERAVELVADLLWAEARRLGFPTTQVQVSTRINVPDGGVDASIDASGITGLNDSFLPEGRTAFQIKTGESFKPWQEAQIKQELFGTQAPAKEVLGDSVRACLETSGTYVLICTKTDPAQPQRADAIRHLQTFFGQCGYADAKVDVWGQSTLIGLVQRFPSLALKVNGNAATHFQTHGVWSSQVEMSRPFKAGAKQQQFIEALLAALRRSDRPVHVRVRGEAGIGKTRLVLEATGSSDIRRLVIYCDGPARLLEGPLMTELLRDGTQLTAILVVDECDLESRTRIWNQLQHQSPRIKVISIYNDLDAPTGATVVQDAPLLEDAQVTEIIEEYGVPKHEARIWAEFCDGSPRVAHVIGQNLKNNPDDVLRQPDTVNVWDRYVAGGDALSSEAVQQRRVVLEHIALFKRFGYGTPVAAEAKAIAALVEAANPQITWSRFQEIVRLLRERKILQGETTRYITPRLLHIKLWADWWDAHGDGFDLDRFTKDLPGQPLEWFLEMFRYAAESKAALKITKALLDETGPFRDPTFFEDRRAPRFFLALTDAAPEAALRCLQRTIGTWDVGQLLKFEEGRREVVWSLERIAVWRELFSGAARLLLRLAEAENENIGNNATGVFADLFSPGHGPVAPTEASPEERFPVLRQALESPSIRNREIALLACEHALETSRFSRMVGSEHQGLRRPPQLWLPKTWGELFDAYRRVWQLLLGRLDVLEPEERDRAIGILARHARGLSQMANLFDMVIDTLSEVADRYPGSRRTIVEAVEHIVHYDGNSFPAEGRQRWEDLRRKLVDTDFHSQMERYVGLDLMHDGIDEHGNVVDKIGPRIMSLARQATENPKLLDAELPWLVTETAKNGYRFGYELGMLDNGFTLLPRLFEVQRQARQNATVFCLGGYFSALLARDRALWENTLDQLVEDEALRGYVPELTWRSGMTERAALRILSLAERGLVPLASLRMFSYGGVVRKVPEQVFARWILVLLASRTRVAAWTALELVHFYYLMGDPKKRPLPRDLTLKVLTAEPFFEKPESRAYHSEDYEWTQVANTFLDQYPEDGVQIAACLLDRFGEEDTITASFNSQAENVLTRIAKQAPLEVWQRIAGYLGPPVDSRAFHISRWLRGGGGLALMPPEEVWNWIEADVEKRARYAATFVPPSLSHSAGETWWARELLVRYGDRKDMRNNLHANFSTEVWTGPESSHYQSKKRWLEDLRRAETHPNVLRWIDEFIDSLNRRIEDARIREERES